MIYKKVVETVLNLTKQDEFRSMKNRSQQRATDNIQRQNDILRNDCSIPAGIIKQMKQAGYKVKEVEDEKTNRTRNNKGV